LKKAGEAVEYDPKDHEVVHLLKKLKDYNGAYPQDRLALRRQGYLKQVAEVSAGAGLVMGPWNMAKGGNGGAGLSSSAGTVVEALLVVALIAEAGVVTYINRDRLAGYFRSITQSPKVEEIASPPVVPPSDFEILPTSTPVIISTGTDVGTLIPVTPSGTPSPVFFAETAQSNETNDVGVQSASTADPGSNPGGPSGPGAPQDPNGNNGNHYGQTPKPERTKEPGNNSDSSSSQESTSNNKKKP
jgi:hypothetical protein